MLYGEVRDPSNPEILSFGPTWGDLNPDLIETWFHREKLVHNHHRAELGLSQIMEPSDADEGDAGNMDGGINEAPEENGNQNDDAGQKDD